MRRFQPLPKTDAASMSASVMTATTPIEDKLKIIATVAFHPDRDGDMQDVFQQTLLQAAHLLGRKRGQQKQGDTDG